MLNDRPWRYFFWTETWKLIAFLNVAENPSKVLNFAKIFAAHCCFDQVDYITLSKNKPKYQRIIRRYLSDIHPIIRFAKIRCI